MNKEEIKRILIYLVISLGTFFAMFLISVTVIELKGTFFPSKECIGLGYPHGYRLNNTLECWNETTGISITGNTMEEDD